MIRRTHRHAPSGPVLGLLLGLLSAAAPLCAQDNRPVAFTNARILTGLGEVIERGAVVVKKGKILAIGKDAAVPAGARIVDCEGGTLMPGLVSANSRAGLVAAPQPVASDPGGRRGRRGARGPAPDAPTRGSFNSAAQKVADRLDPKQDVFFDLLQAGVTTLALTPPGDGFPGLGAILRPDGTDLESLVQQPEAFVYVGMARESRTKKTLKDGFEAAKKAVEARKKPKEEPKAEEPKPAEAAADKPKDGEAKNGEPQKPDQPKPDQPKPDQPKPQDPPKDGDKKPEDQKPEAKPQPKPEEKKDPNTEALADLLEGKRRAIVSIGSAADLMHWRHAVGKDLEFPRTIVCERFDTQSGTLDLALDEVKELKATLLLPPDLSAMPRTRLWTNPVLKLHQAGVEIGFVLGDSPNAVRALFYRLMELHRAGLPAERAIAGVTSVPAKALGIDGEVGALAEGKKANMLLFSGDPLDPTSELRSVWLEGRKVEPQTR